MEPVFRVRAPAPPAQSEAWGRLGGGRRGPLRRSSAGSAGAIRGLEEARRGPSRPPSTIERRLRRRNPRLGGGLEGAVEAPFDDRAPAPPAQSVVGGRFGRGA